MIKLGLSLLVLLSAGFWVPLQAAPTSTAEALSRAHIFAHETFSVSGKRALVSVPISSFSGDEAAKRKQAVAAARIIANNAPAQFTCVFVRYGDSRPPFCEVIVAIRDITSLSVGTSRLDDILNQLAVVCVQPGETGSHILDQYLGAAEKQMDAGNFWEAEQIVDQGLASAGGAGGDIGALNSGIAAGNNAGTISGTSARYTRDMLTLADNFDCWGDPDRAERILRQLIDHRLAQGNLSDADGSRSIQHLCDLLIADKRYQDAETFVRSLMNSDTNNGQTQSMTKDANPAAYAANLERLAQIHTAMGQYDQAAGEFSETIATLENIKGAYGSGLARCLEELADCQARQGKKAEARSTLMRARSIYDHAIVSRIASERIDYQIYNAHVKQIEEKLRRL